MLRTPPFRKLLPLLLLANTGLALAQQAPAPPPPKLDRLEESSESPITVTPPKSGDRRISEKRENGRVTEAKVKNGNNEYTLRPNAPAGNAQPGDVMSSSTRPAQWTVLEFDLNKKKNADKEAPAEEPAAAAPPPKLVK